MSRLVGRALSPALVDRLSQRDLATRLGVALPLVTLDVEGRPHPMLVSYAEIRAYDAGSVGLVIHAGTGSTANLAARDVATLALVEDDVVAYIKLRRVDGPLPLEDEPRLVYFLLAVEEVREDAATAEEAGARIVAGLRYTPVPSLDTPWIRATLAALAAPRARA
jgi:hypothetical protein